MSASEIASSVQEREGWTDTTLLGVVLDYIDNQGSNDAFSDYLSERSEPAEPAAEDTEAGPHYTADGHEIVVGGRYWDNNLRPVTVTELCIHADTNNNPDNGPIGRKTWWHDTTDGMADGSRLALRHPFTGELAPPA